MGLKSDRNELQANISSFTEEVSGRGGMEVCKDWDEYLSSYAADRPIWFVKLSNGETVYQDDGRPNIFPSSAWLRLKRYCQSKHLRIIGMHLQYRSHVIHIGDDCDGYYFCKSAGGFLFSDKTIDSFVIGILTGDSLEVKHWKLPELMLMQTETRSKHGQEECLIEKPIVEGGSVTCRLSAPYKIAMLNNWLENESEKNQQE